MTNKEIASTIFQQMGGARLAIWLTLSFFVSPVWATSTGQFLAGMSQVHDQTLLVGIIKDYMLAEEEEKEKEKPNIIQRFTRLGYNDIGTFIDTVAPVAAVSGFPEVYIVNEAIKYLQGQKPVKRTNPVKRTKPIKREKVGKSSYKKGSYRTLIKDGYHYKY